MEPTAGFTHHTANRLEDLAGELARVLAVPAGGPFDPETVVVGSLGMRQWLAPEIAARLGVCANFEFPFPRAFLDSLLRAVGSDVPPAEEHPIDVATWKIHRALPGLVQRKAFEPVRAFLADGDALKRFQLAEKLAHTFDQYVVYRPEMIRRWETASAAAIGALPGDGKWQALLWRTTGDRRHLAVAREDFGERLARFLRGGEGRSRPAAKSVASSSLSMSVPLPQRVCLFGIPVLPPLLLEMMFELARFVEVHLFRLVPSREYHGEDLHAKQRARRAGGAGRDGAPAGAPGVYDSTGHPLLASLGRASAATTELLLEANERAGHRLRDGAERFVEPCPPGADRGAASVLHILQSDILCARARGDGCELPRFAPATQDGSIAVQACHSPMREVEVLYDGLLDLFAQDPTLRPRDILVMTPEIETYAPFVHTVFEYPEEEARRIPFSVSDRHPRSERPVIDAFLRLLELPGTRCTAPEVFALLETPVVRAKFKFGDAEIALIRTWIQKTGICWGIDGAHREAFNLPAFDANSWRAGLDRLLLGYAMAGGGREMFEGVLPCDDIEGSSAEVLGRFVSAANALLEFVESAAAPRSPAEWTRVFQNVLDVLFSAGDHADARDLTELRAELDKLRRVAANAGAERDATEFPVVRHHLRTALGAMEQRGAFLGGGVTFCSLTPMRTIPARVVCLLGMNEASFPRRVQPVPWDLIARERPARLGDPSVRDDDRHTFLDAILAARERLVISFVGRDLRSNEAIPPSVVVSELLDYLDRSCVFPPERGKDARAALVTGHPLQAFSPRYFGLREKGVDGAERGNDAGESFAARLFSYSTANAAAAAVMIRARSHGTAFTGAAPALFPAPLAEAGSDARSVEIAGLIDFFKNPAKHLLSRRLNIRLDEPDTCLGEVEPMELDGLERYSVKQELLSEWLSTGAMFDRATLAARGVLPPGELGARQFFSMRREARAFCAKLRQYVGDGRHRDEPALIDLRIGEFALSGRIDSRYGGRLVVFRCAKVKAADRLAAWIQHLALCAQRSGSDPKGGEGSEEHSSVLLAKDAEARFAPIASDEAVARLAELLAVFWRGLAQPVPFFPASAWEYARAKFYPSPRARSSPLAKARSAWAGNDRAPGERNDPCFARCFGSGDGDGNAEPLGTEFQETAETVFKPLLDCTGGK